MTITFVKKLPKYNTGLSLYYDGVPPTVAHRLLWGEKFRNYYSLH
ncbi:hypothetical protein [Anabaena sp. UHCC 0399]|nr:hypothetical protein [Anabaena sp. UHCC 0399]MEA5568888.1 hypothetical protein [Anabaena sp. UHCC 0399]